MIGVDVAASPHTRGWTASGAFNESTETGFPAHAGMDPLSDGSVLSYDRLPRTRGDGPAPDAAVDGLQVASPHTRGWTRDGFRAAAPAAGFPAHAGMDLSPTAPVPARRGLPRTRGDGPHAVRATRSTWKASPHTRGWTRGSRRRRRSAPGFPAHAGMDPALSSAARAS